MSYSEEQIQIAKEKYKEQLYQGMTYSINKFDDQILYISSGALVLSLSFIGEVVTLDKSAWLSILYASWAILSLTTMLSIYTHLDAYHLHAKQLNRLEQGEELIPFDEKTTLRNHIMLIMLMTGLCLQIAFVIINIQRMKNQNSNSPTKQGPHAETIKVPSPGSSETLGAPVMPVPAALKPPVDTTNVGSKK